jgi:hypothetical protein
MKQYIAIFLAAILCLFSIMAEASVAYNDILLIDSKLQDAENLETDSPDHSLEIYKQLALDCKARKLTCPTSTEIFLAEKLAKHDLQPNSEKAVDAPEIRGSARMRILKENSFVLGLIGGAVISHTLRQNDVKFQLGNLLIRF